MIMLNTIFRLYRGIYSVLWNLRQKILLEYIKRRMGYCGENVVLHYTSGIRDYSKLYMYDNTNIYHGFKLISYSGNFIMKEYSGAAEGLTVITGNHTRQNGKFLKAYMHDRASDNEDDVVVEEDVWLGANVTLCSGVKIGRGANIGTGSVVRKNIPPYAIAVGNPAKVVGFCFTPDEIVEHEKVLYSEEKRLPFELLKTNYNKYFLKRLREIKEFTRL